MTEEDEKQLELLLKHERSGGGVLKWLFAFLLLANAGLWMWNQWIREGSESDSVRARPPVAAEKLRLISEPGVKLDRRGSAPPQPKPKPAEACYRVGPFGAQDAAQSGAGLLAGMNVGYERREQTQTVVTGYRVLLAPFPNKQAAERQRTRLTRLGFKDHALAQESGGKYTVSLGVYSVEANAQKRIKELKAKNVTAAVEPISETRAAYWLEIDRPDGGLIDEETIDKLRRQDWGSPQIKLTATVCAAPGENSSTAKAAKP